MTEATNKDRFSSLRAASGSSACERDILGKVTMLGGFILTIPGIAFILAGRRKGG